MELEDKELKIDDFNIMTSPTGLVKALQELKSSAIEEISLRDNWDGEDQKIFFNVKGKGHFGQRVGKNIWHIYDTASYTIVKTMIIFNDQIQWANLERIDDEEYEEKFHELISAIKK